jgi:hypothetical protein
MNWARARYTPSVIEDRVVLATLELLCNSKYHIVYQLTGDDTNQYIVVWKDQHALSDLLQDNPGAVFGLKFLKRNNSKYAYDVNTPHGRVLAVTLAEAAVLVDGTEDNPRNLYVTSSGTVIIE